VTLLETANKSDWSALEITFISSTQPHLLCTRGIRYKSHICQSNILGPSTNNTGIISAIHNIRLSLIFTWNSIHKIILYKLYHPTEGLCTFTPVTFQFIFSIPSLNTNFINSQIMY
jgi:hypothetical protein